MQHQKERRMKREGKNKRNEKITSSFFICNNKTDFENKIKKKKEKKLERRRKGVKSI